MYAYNHLELILIMQPRSFSQLNFLISELLVLAWSASVQRANAYKTPVKVDDKRPKVQAFRVELLKFMEQDLLPHYRSKCSEHQHISNLLSLVEFGTRIGGDLFDARGYRLGIAQKFLNMVLKSLWALDLIPEPPHCPVDSVVSKYVPRKARVTWTQLTEIEKYMGVIEALKLVAAKQGLTVAEWELQHFERREAMMLNVSAISGIPDNPRC